MTILNLTSNIMTLLQMRKLTYVEVKTVSGSVNASLYLNPVQPLSTIACLDFSAQQKLCHYLKFKIFLKILYVKMKAIFIIFSTFA
jgi:hypothetical protein